MAEKTKIAWCDSTFNPFIGCTKVGPGCDNCYAEADFDLRRHCVKWGAGQPRIRTSAANWKKPRRWNHQGFYECPDCGLRGTTRIMGDEPKVCKHLNAQPARRRVFCASLADVFDNEVPVEWRRDLFALIDKTPNIDWLLLTKRIGNAERMMADATAEMRARDPGRDFLNNIWIGATICNQEEADRDIPKLLQTPAGVRWISAEPLLGPVDLSDWLCDAHPTQEQVDGPHGLNYLRYGAPQLDWIIAGGESGPKARPMHPAWVRGLRDQCKIAGVPFLFKQWGEWHPTIWLNGGNVVISPTDGYRAELIADLKMVRCGKKAAGRLLDGVLHDGYPKAVKWTA